MLRASSSGKASFLQKLRVDLWIVPEFPGKTRVTPSASGVGRIVSFNSVKLCGFLRPNMATVPTRAEIYRSNPIGKCIKVELI